MSAAILCRYHHVAGLRYWKPIQTGIERDDDTAEVQRLTGRGAEAVLDAGVRLPRPVSPHLAAAMSGTVIQLDALIDAVHREPATDRWVVEGAGGLLVPVNETDLMIDLAARLGLPVVVVARTGLGTINHTLLTLEALGARSLVVAGVVMVGAPDNENRRAIEFYGRTTVIGEVPMLDPLEPDALQRWARAELDLEGHLLRFLR